MCQGSQSGTGVRSAITGGVSGLRCTGQGRGRLIERASNTDGIWFAYASGWGVRLDEESEYGCGRVGVALGRRVVGVSNDAALHNARVAGAG